MLYYFFVERGGGPAIAGSSVCLAQVLSPLEQPVVSQGGATVTLGDVDAFMQHIPAEKRVGFVNSAERIEGMLKDILRTKELALQARQLKLDQSVEARFALKLAEDDALAKMRLMQFNSDLKVPDLNALSREEYLAHKDRYVIPADVTVQHVLISVQGRSVEDALKLAETVRAEAVRDPSVFEDLVQKYSDDPSKASNHGRMKDATSEKYVAEFAKAAGALTQAAPISPPVKTKFGYHILKLLDRKPEQQQTFEQAKDKILANLRDQYISDQRRNFLNELSNKPLEPNPEVIGSLHERYARMAPAADESVPPSANANGDAAPR
jgi:peptidyl-prolyl cis-trans isomerase C